MAMEWPYHAPAALSPQQLAQRHDALIFYGRLSHLSSLAPLLVAVLLRIAAPWLSGSSRRRHRVAAGSPLAKTLRKLSWWVTDDVCLRGAPRGRRDEWILGLAWAAWSLALCVHGTGTDYFHLTKRFGIVAIAQLPAQYLMALRPLNPYSWALGCSHEHVNRYHRLLGSVVYALLLVHVLLFNNMFLRIGLWVRKLAEPVVLLGHALALVVHALAGTALLPRVRRYSYRVFFVTHILVALALPCLVFLHARHARPYVAQALAVLSLDFAVRAGSRASVRPSSLALVPHTSLVRLALPVPAGKAAAFRAMPAAHVYLHIASAKPVLFNLLFHPFSVASVGDRSITLVARRRAGPMTTTLAALAACDHPDRQTVVLGIEGPYGTMASRYAALLAFAPSRVLLFAGGVGATFAVPLYIALTSGLPSAKTHFAWSLRNPHDAAWAFSEPDDSASHLALGAARGSVRLYLTTERATSADIPAPRLPGLHRGRPDVPKLVGDAFRGHHGRVAVMVCGPAGLARAVRAQVRPWAMRGRDVWWHEESFEW